MPAKQFTNEEIADMHKAVTELRACIEADTEKEAQNNEKIEKLNEVLDKYEAKHQEMLAEVKRIENEARDREDKISALDKALSRQTVNKEVGDNYKETPEYKALYAFVKEGRDALFKSEVKAYLRTDVDAQGGYLVPEELAPIILKQIEEISPVRQFARVWTMRGKSFSIPVRTGVPTAAYESELESSSASTSTYRSETMTAYRQQAIVGSTQDILMFSGFNMESEIMGDAAEAFATTEGNKFVKGTGVKEPEGIIGNATLIAGATATTESTGSITGAGLFDDVINLSGDLKIGYNPIYFFNRSTLSFLRTAKSSAGGYLWQVGGTTMPMQIAGYDYAIFQDMPSVNTASGTLFLGFGDLYRGYSIFDSLQMAVVRDDVTQAAKALILFNIFRWNTGQVVVPEAIKLLKEKA